MNDNKEHIPKRLPPVRLPFEKKRSDFGGWSYDHRVGICVTLIAYLIFAVIFVLAKINMNSKSYSGALIMEMPREEKWELTPEQQRALQEAQWEDFSDVRNLASNENAEQEFNSDLRDDRGTEASQLYEDAGKLEEAMRANREAYEAALRQEQAAERNNNPGDGENSDTHRQDSKVQGRVTVSFSFVDPLRTSVNLITPAYMCAGGGTVELTVTLDNNGCVTSTAVNKSSSSGDECMQTAAIDAARRSRFNVDSYAPSRHKGTITYIFIPQ